MTMDTKKDKPILNVVGTLCDEKTGTTTKKAVIRQKINRKTGKLCSRVSIFIVSTDIHIETAQNLAGEIHQLRYNPRTEQQ